MDMTLPDTPDTPDPSDTASPPLPYVSLKIGLGTPIVLAYRQAIRVMDILATAETFESRYGTGSESIEPFDETVIAWRFLPDARYQRIKARGARIRNRIEGEESEAATPPTPATTRTTTPTTTEVS